MTGGKVPDMIKGSPELHKYWNDRYQLFSKYDQGIKLDRGEEHKEP